MKTVQSALQDLPARTFARESITDQHVAVTETERVKQLEHLVEHLFVELELHFSHLVIDGLEEVDIVVFRELAAFEEVIEKCVEERDVFAHKFREVHVAYSLHDDLLLVHFACFLFLDAARTEEHTLDSS